MDDFTARMLERARNRAIRCNLTTGVDMTPSVASAKPPTDCNVPLTGSEPNTDRDRSPVRGTGGAPSGDDEMSAENKENSGPQKSSDTDTLHACTRSHLKDLSSLYRIVDGTDSPSCAAGMSPPSSALQQRRRGHQLVDSAVGSRPTDDSQESAGGGRAARSLRTRLASLGSRYHQQDERDLSARQQEIKQQEERDAAAAAARSPTRCRRWQVRSPSPLRRQVGPGERPAAAAEDDQQVMGIGEPSPPPVHRASLHLLPRAGLTGSSSPAHSPTKSSTTADVLDDEAHEHQQRVQKKLKQSDSGEDVRRPAGNSPTKRNETARISPSKLDQDALRSLNARGLASADSRSRQPYGLVRGSPPPRVVASVTKPQPDVCRSPSPTKAVSAPYRSVSPMRCAFRDQVSPERQASPNRHLSPTRQPSPTRHLSPERQASPTRHLSPTRRQPSPVRGRLIQERAALFDNNAALAQPQLDPTELSLADRRKLFENGQPPKVVARFGTAVTPDMLRQQAEAAAAAASATVVSKKRSAPEPPPSAGVVRDGVRGELGQGSSSFQASRSVWETVHSKQQSSSSSVADPGLAQRQQRQHEINQLANKWRKPAPQAPVSSAVSSQPLQEGPAKVIPPPPPPPPAQHQSSGTANSDGRYAVRVKPGCLYPCLSDLDSEQSEDSSLPPETSEHVASDATVSRLSGVSDAESMGTRIQSLARQHQHGEHHGQHHYEQPSSLGTINELTDSSTMDEDEYSQMSSLAACAAIDEVLEDMDGAQSEVQTPPKRAKTADSPGVFRTPLVSVKSPDKDPNLPAVVVDKDAEMPLMHSVSFYRRQKPQEVVVTPVRRIVRNPDVPKYTAPAVPGSEAAAAGHQLSADQRSQEAASVQERIRCLHKEVEQQQAVMTQAGRALQLCDERVEFAGSQEMVEAERLLLVATHRRQAVLCEVQRLRTEGVMHQRGIGGRSAAATRRGAISISSISLPLKSSFVRQVAAGDAEHVYHFICLLRYRGVVIATQLLSSLDSIKGGAINFPNLVKFSELEADFSVALEVYGLPTRPELMSHDAKYRIRKESRSKTPKKLLKHQSQTSASPGGSGSASARVSGFQLLGFVHLTGRSVSAAGGGGSCGGWNLERVPFSCPLEGQLLARVSVQAACSVAGDDEADEEQLVGFVTVFDDVNGLGAWHRRWCRLAGDRLCFWQYPEHDEQRRDPCQVMSLRDCITERVGAVARDVCARQNTLLLVMVRPSRPEDPEDSLVLQRHGRQTRIRNLLSFDTKEERVHWCDRINDTLSCLRAWEPESTQQVTNN